MSQALLAIIVSLVEEAVKLAPSIVADFQAIFSKPNPTPADWAALRASILEKSYEDFVPDTGLTPDSTTPPTPPTPPTKP